MHVTAHTRVCTSHPACEAPPHTPADQILQLPAQCGHGQRSRVHTNTRMHAHTRLCTPIPRRGRGPVCPCAHSGTLVLWLPGLLLSACASRRPDWVGGTFTCLWGTIWAICESCLGTAGAGAASVDRKRLAGPMPTTGPGLSVLPASTQLPLGETDLQTPTVLGSTGPS